MSWSNEVGELFGFDGEAWFERMREAIEPSELGSLGPYRLLEEIGRGGQGVVFRALQPGTGRVIAVKRLLAGSLASPASLRRFQREAEVVAALVHPGIVTVHGVEFVDGSPLLAMEWVDGVPLADWARTRPRAEVLQAFVQVCEAVQHAHQHGVLHRDLKPANVLVEAGGRPRLLDFGLAKLSEGGSSTLSETGAFLGTPAYAAPEQLRGEPSDVRTDIHALGALLFELLTGRRAVEGEGFEAVARASAFEPIRPSSVQRSIPRDLDAIVLQAMASEPAHRYQSVDALLADLGRFVEGRPVLAHGPGVAYLLRKFIGRNRAVSAAILLLLVLAVAFIVMGRSQARRLTEERNRAVAAGAREREERERAEAEQRRAEERRQEAELARAAAVEAEGSTRAILSFLVNDVISEANPEKGFGHVPTMVEVLVAASARVPRQFGDRPSLEMHVRHSLGLSLSSLGAFAEAAAELRRALELEEGAGDATGLEIVSTRTALANALSMTGGFVEARTLLETNLQWLEGQDCELPETKNQLIQCLYQLQLLAMKSNRLEEGIALNDRLLEIVTDEKLRLTCRGNKASFLASVGKDQEALMEWEDLIDEMIALEGEGSINVGILCLSMSSSYMRTGNLPLAIEMGRQAVDVLHAAYGEQHLQVATALARLAEALVVDGQDEEARTTAERGIRILRGSSHKGLVLPDLIYCLAIAHLHKAWKSGDRESYERAAAAFQESADLYESLFGRSIGKWANSIHSTHESLIGAGRFLDADELLEKSSPEIESRYKGWALACRAASLERKGDDDGAYQLFEQAIDALEGVTAERRTLRETLHAFAELRKRLGDLEGAAELEQRAEDLKSGR